MYHDIKTTYNTIDIWIANAFAMSDAIPTTTATATSIISIATIVATTNTDTAAIARMPAICHAKAIIATTIAN